MSGKRYISEEPDSRCELCGKIDECRPYGTNGEQVCFDCAMKDEKAAERQFAKGRSRPEAGEGGVVKSVTSKVTFVVPHSNDCPFDTVQRFTDVKKFEVSGNVLRFTDSEGIEHITTFPWEVQTSERTTP